MTGWTWVSVVWAVLVGPVAVLIGKGIRAMDPGQDHQPEQQPDGQVDLLEGLPYEVLGPAEVDQLFVRIVAPLDRELQ